MPDFDHPQSSSHLSAAILAAGLVLAAAVGSWTFYSVRSFDNPLPVTGSAKMAVAADMVLWSGQFTRSVDSNGIKAGYDQMRKDSAAVAKFLKKNTIDDKNVTISTVFMDQDYSYNVNSGQPRNYILRQTVDVGSADVAGVTKIAKNTDELINQGVLFSTQALNYTVTKLPELRVTLLKDAIKDARARAASIAENDGKSVGSLKSASIGVVQVLAPNSTAVDDYGSYDTSSIEKEVMVTVRASFQLR
ncbi:SIMPL domain-containing protein [Candidatus Peregrinibacteria bacterium]|nr:SIMPL domain-containing protein [Candidatus Peregrinibacteria bacterium]